MSKPTAYAVPINEWGAATNGVPFALCHTHCLTSIVGLGRASNAENDVGLRLDMLVEERVIVEVKAINRILPVHSAQLLSYLRLSDKRVGLLLNFHVRQLRQGIQRMVNGFEED